MDQEGARSWARGSWVVGWVALPLISVLGFGVFEVAQCCDEETLPRNIFSMKRNMSTKTGGSLVQMDLGTRGQEDPGRWD